MYHFTNSPCKTVLIMKNCKWCHFKFNLNGFCKKEVAVLLGLLELHVLSCCTKKKKKNSSLWCQKDVSAIASSRVTEEMDLFVWFVCCNIDVRIPELPLFSPNDWRGLFTKRLYSTLFILCFKNKKLYFSIITLPLCNVWHIWCVIWL